MFIYQACCLPFLAMAAAMFVLRLQCYSCWEGDFVEVRQDGSPVFHG